MSSKFYTIIYPSEVNKSLTFYIEEGYYI